MREINRLLTKLTRIFQSKKQILASYLFGSQALGKANQESDIDIAVFVNDKDRFHLRKFLLVSAKKEALPDNLDLVVVDLKSSPLLLFQIIKTGQCFYQKKSNLSSELEARILHLYYDNSIFARSVSSTLKRVI